MAALLFKMGALGMKTVAKPLGDRFRNWVMSHPEYRQTVLKAAQRIHRLEVTISRRADGKEGRTFIGDMTEEKSVELASKIASESFIFAVGSLLIFIEYDRNRKKEIKKQQQAAAERHEIIARASMEREQLMVENIHQQQLIEAMVKRLEAVETTLQHIQEQKFKQQQSLFGGFFSTKAL